jgi:hypothetical protein
MLAAQNRSEDADALLAEARELFERLGAASWLVPLDVSAEAVGA